MKNGVKILRESLQTIPNKTGVYRYYNSVNKIIYVGKAVNLNKRISDYIRNAKIDPKTKRLVSNIAKVEYTIVESEQDAFLLENNLIKTYQPFYNILLKDDKSYTKIIITKEKYPRVLQTRNIKIISGEVYGPYSSKRTVDFIIETIYKLYPLRTCKHDLEKNDNVKPCLKYYIGKCCGICQNKKLSQQYNTWINQIKKIIKGDINTTISEMKEEMNQEATNLNYERAEQIKHKIQILLKFNSKNIITNTNITNTDVYAYKKLENEAFICTMHINNGSIIKTKTISYHTKLKETDGYILSIAIEDLKKQLNTNAIVAIVPFMPEITNNTMCRKPKNKIEEKLLELANKNVEEYIEEKNRANQNRNTKYKETVKELTKMLGLSDTPRRIESYDISHLKGTNTVGTCISFYDGKPKKSEYRKFIIKNSEGGDDYASTKEIVKRRFKHIKESNKTPDLIIADGGEIQMNAIDQIVNKEMKLNIPIIGLKKNKQHTTNKILFGTPPKEINTSITSPLFQFMATIQNEVHRFAISYHIKKRGQNQTKSMLETIKGIGPKTRQTLILKYKSIENLKREDPESLANVIGKYKAYILFNFLHGNI